MPLVSFPSVLLLVIQSILEDLQQEGRKERNRKGKELVSIHFSTSFSSDQNAILKSRMFRYVVEK